MRRFRFVSLALCVVSLFVCAPAAAMRIILLLFATSASMLLILQPVTPPIAATSGDWYVGDSTVHGKGIMARRDFSVGEYIGVGIDGLPYPQVTYLGSMINHSKNPNIVVQENELAQQWDLVAIKPISEGEELLVNYDDAPWFIQRPLPYYK